CSATREPTRRSTGSPSPGPPPRLSRRAQRPLPRRIDPLILARAPGPQRRDVSRAARHSRRPPEETRAPAGQEPVPVTRVLPREGACQGVSGSYLTVEEAGE